jgi:mannose-6-phosphate isomerase-like protein (cupin superfamily)
MDISAVNIGEKFKRIDSLHTYKIVAQMNDYLFKLVRMKREFIWHKHEETDEVFMVIEGELQIDLPGNCLRLKEGEMVVIPKGVAHKPSSVDECKLLLIEPADTVNTGDAGGELTDTDLEWI